MGCVEHPSRVWLLCPSTWLRAVSTPPTCPAQHAYCGMPARGPGLGAPLRGGAAVGCGRAGPVHHRRPARGDDGLAVPTRHGRGPDPAGQTGFGNHGCDPNLGWVDASSLATMVDVPAGRELLTDYAMATTDPAYTAALPLRELPLPADGRGHRLADPAAAGALPGVVGTARAGPRRRRGGPLTPPPTGNLRRAPPGLGAAAARPDRASRRTAPPRAGARWAASMNPTRATRSKTTVPSAATPTARACTSAPTAWRWPLPDDEFPLTKRYAAELVAGGEHDRLDFARGRCSTAWAAVDAAPRGPVDVRSARGGTSPERLPQHQRLRGRTERGGADPGARRRSRPAYPPRRSARPSWARASARCACRVSSSASSPTRARRAVTWFSSSRIRWMPARETPSSCDSRCTSRRSATSRPE